MTPGRLTLADVEAARAVLARHLRPTPLRESFAAAGVDLRLKLECWQPTGSFKVRGALSLLSSLDEGERRRGVVAASAGNHALGVAFAAARSDRPVDATLFVPRTAPRSKVDKLRRFPVRIRETGETYDDAVEAARLFERQTGAVFVHAYDDRRTAAGQGTVGLEVVDEWPELGAVLVPVGGGGLIAGLATAVKERVPNVRVVAVQPEASPSLRESLRLGRPLLTYPAAPTLADGLAGGIGEILFHHRDLVDEVVEVTEEEIEDAMVALLASDQVVAEASGAVGVAALRAGKLPSVGRGPVVAVITGGNVDASVLARLLARRLPADGAER
ncbi:MAG TPA: pyridoxal-phosphate dependent enzyme [Vicinamibacteria bacterium]|nr:pyridoxal-phosphate dependent enzyme [Vicinamibacteria bacterium]